MTPPKINAQIQQIANAISKGITDHNVEQRCIKLLKKHPKNTNLILQYGLLLYLQKKYIKAESILKNGITLTPRHSDLQIILFACFKDNRNYEKMLELCHSFKTSSNINEQALAYTAYLEVCDWNQAAKLEKNIIKAAIEGKIQRKYLSAILLLSNGLPHISIKDQYKLHSNWGAVFSPRKLLDKQTKPSNRIRIAYVSADFYRHPVGFFMLQIIASHHRDKFEVFCYAQLMSEHDEVTELFKSNADHFIDITQMDDQMLAQKMQHDQIHIAVDLSGHTFDSRTQAFGKRMAPVQISYLGYPNTSGLDAMDFHISDRYAEDLERGTEYTEKLLLMPKSFLLYGMEWTETKNTTAPCEDTGIISFGSFNHSRKLNLDVIQVWSSILTSVSNSRLYLKFFGSESPLVQTNIYNAFKKQGINKERITILASSPTPSEHILMYHRIDIALDTFPYTGTTTTCEALSQGVPVVTLVGPKHSNRVSYSILKNIGFEDSIAYSKKEYIEKAINLAQNPQGLSILRKCLPTLLQHSPLRNSEEFISDLEQLYKEAWKLKMGQPAFIEKDPELIKLTMNDDITIMSPHNLDDITTYVLTEQGDWHEDELDFLRCITKPSMRILDCSAEYGCYSLSLAKVIGHTGSLLALEVDSNKRKAIEESAKENKFTWLNVSTKNDASTFLKAGVDIMIHPAKGIDTNSSYLDLPENISPLIMIRSITENGLDEALAKRMQSQGYNSYRLIPALKLLIPIQKGFTPTSCHQQAFFCKEDKAKEFANDGFLLLHELDSIDIPDDLSNWQRAIESRAYASELLPLWIEQGEKKQTSGDWEQVRNTLSAYAMAYHHDTNAQQCYAYLTAALNLLLNTENLQSSTPRLSTLARIAAELGNYTLAMQALDMVAEGIKVQEGFMPSEPFLPVSSDYDQDDYKNLIAEWMLAQSIAQSALLSKPTSFPINSDALKEINIELSNLGSPNTELKYREKISLKRNQGLFISASELRKDRPMFSIIIPTRERHDTLKYAIESALNQQDFDDYEIVVMDNLSSKETHDVVLAFHDPKIKYFRSSERLAMHDNWELALSHSAGEYIFFLGDDDAIMPDALFITSALIHKYHSDVISWEKPTYWWGNSIVPHHRNRLYMSPTPNKINILNSKDMLKKYLKAEISYDSLPGVYNSFANRTLIQKIKNIHGRYFMTPSPDISSSILNAYFSDHYICLSRGLSISGNSKHSTGCSHLWPNLNSSSKEQFQLENRKNKKQETFPQLIESNNMAIGLAKEFLLIKRLFFPESIEFDINIIGLLNSMSANINITPDQYEKTIQDIKTLTKKHKITANLNLIPLKETFHKQATQGLVNNNQILAINCEQAGISNALQATQLIQGIWPKWQN